jgi:glycosyltransferase Alg8
MQTSTGAAGQAYHFDDPAKPLARGEKWSPDVIARILLFFCVCFMGLLLIPNTIWDNNVLQFTYVIGILGIWRYAWWMTHAVRARIFGQLVYPRMRQRAEALWESGWRPSHIHFMMTTFREERDITEAVIRGIVSQVREAGVPATLWLGSGDRYDEDIIERHLRLVASDLDITFHIVRQIVPGKRMAIATVLRAMARKGLKRDDLVVFMDGDFVIAPGALRRCLPLFAADRELRALTTDEAAIVRGPRWMQSMLDLRFAQRRMAMQSHALSNRVLTLTGRMSVFRGSDVVKNEFIRLLEADYLEHWLWGSFRFLSGDDKSTWYYLLKHNAKMTFVPDALGYTIETIKGSAFQRMVENWRRWSGNMLRNGARALRLGPAAMPFFIWWCILDQRIAMWTMLVSPMLALSATMVKGWAYLTAYLLYIAITRMLLSLLMFAYARRVDLNFPWILYLNQAVNATVKVYILWRLSKQKWANRGNQKAGFESEGWQATAREAMASYLTVLSVLGLFLGVMAYTGLLDIPTWHYVKTLLLS